MAVDQYSAPNKVSSDVVPIDYIKPSSINPRKHFDETKLQELSDSIKRIGLLEPIVVRFGWGDSPEKPPFYEIVAGERRWRASRIAGLTEVPIRNLGRVDDKAALEMAMVENLQRSDLDPIEEAEGYRALNQVVGLKQAQIAAAVNRSQPTIANRMRLLELPEDVQEKIRTGQLSPSHGVALAKFGPFPAVASKLGELAVLQGLTSAQLEEPIPASYQLREAGVIVAISPHEIDDSICEKACPFQAYRGASWWKACLHPEHYRELAKAKEEARTAEWRANEEERRAQLAEKDPEAAAALPPIDKVKLVDAAVPHSAGYEEIGSRPPPGCNADCSCRCQILHYGRLVDACNDPSRYKRLERGATIATNRERRADAKALKAKVATKLESLTEVGSSELLILATQALGPSIGSHEIAPAWRALYGDGDTMHDGRNLEALDLISLRQGEIAFLRLAIGAILNAELDGYHDGTRGSAQLTKWYLNDSREATSAIAWRAGGL